MSCFLFFFASGFLCVFCPDFLKSMAASFSTFLMALILLPSCFCLFSLVGVEAGVAPASLFSSWSIVEWPVNSSDPLDDSDDQDCGSGLFCSMED